MSKTRKREIFCDPILKKGHYHVSRLKEPDVDEELELYFKELDQLDDEYLKAYYSEEDEEALLREQDAMNHYYSEELDT